MNLDEKEIGLTVFETALGWIGVAASGRGIVALNLPRPTREAALSDLRARWPKADLLSEEALGDLGDQLRRYAAGEGVAFRVDLDLSHQTPFRRRVLEATLRIPYGETRSYAWIARQIGKPKAYRAVGQALRANPIPILIPCHRVVASDGGLRGYAGGLEMKRRLLALERG
ncbi:MAG TPA: methylated-DNA--[protein]-cysteine S-methyltransferase [Anaerolineae bacterium]|nr:methylated-DNA--[protein]-cysteine S-methyltransferase [Anaerolineae bacterium]